MIRETRTPLVNREKKTYYLCYVLSKKGTFYWSIEMIDMIAWRKRTLSTLYFAQEFFSLRIAMVYEKIFCFGKKFIFEFIFLFCRSIFYEWMPRNLLTPTNVVLLSGPFRRGRDKRRSLMSSIKKRFSGKFH